MNKNASSLLEIIIAIAIFMIVATGLSVSILGSLSGTQQAEQRLRAQGFAIEGLEAARSIADADYSLLTVGDHGISDASGYWDFAGSSDSPAPGFTRRVSVTNVGQYLKEIAVSVSWQITPANSDEVRSITRIANIRTSRWTQTTSADFSGGTRSQTSIVSSGDGAIQLTNLGDWSAGTVHINYNLAGDGDVEALGIEGNTLYLSIKNDGSEREFIALSMANIAQGTLTRIGETELGTTTNDLIVKNGYAYIASEDNSQEIKIINLSNYQLVNGINLPGSGQAHSLMMTDSTLYVGTSRNSGNPEFFAYNVTNPLASPIPLLWSTEIDDRVNDIAIQGNYAYLATDHNSRELAIVGLSNHLLVNSLNVSGDANMRTVIAAGNDLYMGRTGSSNPELYKLNISNPLGSIGTLATIQIASDTVTDMTIYGGKLYVTLDGHLDEIFLITLSPFAIESQLNTGTFETKSILPYDVYIIIGNDDSQSTLQVIRGGSGSNQSYATPGGFTSSAFDTGGANTNYGALSWSVAGTGTTNFQLRTAATQADLSSAAWVGPDGTANSQYTASDTQIQPAPGASKQWIQWKATLTGNGSATPTLESVSIAY